MRTAALLACAASAAMLAAPAPAADDEPHPSLAEVLDGATALTAVGNYVVATGADGAWVCALDISSKHFAALVERDDVVAEQTVPGAICVPASHFKNLAE